MAGFLFCLGAMSAHAQFSYGFGYLPERYVIIRSYPVVETYRYSDVEDYSPQPTYYLYDYVNRASALTPEPVWRNMFPGIRDRMEAEMRMFGTVGQSAGEVNYHRAFRRARDSTRTE
jgi:hypothetical protein